MVMVQGDTSSALGGALAARDAGCQLAHVEAGLRTHDPMQPWPEEENRIRIDRIADLMFAPTYGNASNLHRERVDGVVHVTGNPGIDALAEITGNMPLRHRTRWFSRRGMAILVTCHRRENWGEGLDSIATALKRLSAEPGMAIDVILHPNPTVAESMWRLMGQNNAIRLVPPQSHQATIERMRRADLVLSDSGGIQEEAPALGIPLLVLRDKTERPESLASGTAMLVGNDADRIVELVRCIRDDRKLLERMSTPAMPFGDGQSGPRIAALTLAYLDEMASDDGDDRAARA